VVYLSLFWRAFMKQPISKEYRECLKCEKPIRGYNKTGYCSSCQKKLWRKKKNENTRTI